MTVEYNTYEEVEDALRISGVSPEAYTAEVAWNAALRKALSLVRGCSRTEDTVGGLVAMLEEEITQLDTGLSVD